MNTPLIKRFSIVITAVFLLSGFCYAEKRRNPALFQVSTIGSLMEGNFDGVLTVKELRKKGNTGIGTFNALNGEMIVLDGVCYRATPDGACTTVPDSETTPFAVIAPFTKTEPSSLPPSTDMKTAGESIKKMLTLPCQPYALRIHGRFDLVRLRSVPPQAKPYPRLGEVTATLKPMERSGVSGTIIGFFLPENFAGINVPGGHFHFISDDHTFGGHLLDFRAAEQLAIQYEPFSEFHLILPSITTDTGTQPDAAERDRVEKQPLDNTPNNK